MEEVQIWFECDGEGGKRLGAYERAVAGLSQKRGTP